MIATAGGRWTSRWARSFPPSDLLVPKFGWVQFRRPRALAGWKSYRVSRDRAGRWRLAFAVVPEPILGPGAGEVVGVDRGVSVAVALSSGEMTSPGKLAAKVAERLLRLRRRLARAQMGSNRRAAVRTTIARLKAREADRRKDWVEKVNPAYTSQTARGDRVRLARSVKREPQLVTF
jgi:putative transposase